MMKNSLVCESCFRLSPFVENKDDSVDAALDSGWTVEGNNEDWKTECPNCRVRTEALVKEIADRISNSIDAWHEGAGAGKSLHDFLGWTWEEYKDYVEDNIIPEKEFNARGE